MTKKVDDDNNLVRLYWRSRALHFSSFFYGLTGFLLSMVSTFKMHSRSSRRSMLSSEKQKGTIVFAIAIILSVVVGSSLLGRLNSRDKTPHIFDVEIHSGFWAAIPEYESSCQVFIVENPTEYPLRLELKTLDFRPLTSCLHTIVSWDYDGEPLLPDKAVEIKVILENVGQAGTLLVSLDLHILGFITE